MSHDNFHAWLRSKFGSRVPHAAEFFDIPESLETVITAFFSRLAALDVDGRCHVLRVWIDGKLRIAVDGGLDTLDDLIHDTEEAAAKILKAQLFPLHPDADWYEQLVDRYGDAVPPITRLRIRSGLQQIVAEMLEFLADHGLLEAVEILSMTTRSAAFVVIDARDRPGIGEDDRIALDFLLEKTRERLTEVCEHCGRGGALIAKTGLEARLVHPEAVLGDRLLCLECHEVWRSHD